MAVALTSACSYGASGDALARKVCIGGGPRADGLGSVADAASYDKNRAWYDAAAALSARAAKLDNKWNALATAFSGESDVFAEGVAPVAHGFTGSLTQADAQLEGVLAARARDYEATIRAECLKANA